MKKLRPEFVAAMAQIVRFSADGEITLETIKKCCDQGIKRLENAANSNEYENGESVLIFVDYDRNGKEGVAYFNARIKEDFFDDSTGAGDVPAPVRAAEVSKEERIRALRLSISDYLSKIEGAAHSGRDCGHALSVADDIAVWASRVQAETKELAKLDPKMVERWKKIHESFLSR